MSLSCQTCPALAPVPAGHLTPERAWEIGASVKACQLWASASREGRRGPRAWEVLILEERRLRRLEVTEKAREGTQSRLLAVKRVRDLQFSVTGEDIRATDAFMEGMQLDRRKDFLCVGDEIVS